MKNLFMILLMWIPIIAGASVKQIKEVKAKMESVANYQIREFDNMNKAGQAPWVRTPLGWNNGTLYYGMHAWSELSDDKKYHDWLYDLAQEQDYKLQCRQQIHADDVCIGGLYLLLHSQYKDDSMLTHIKQKLDSIMIVDPNRELLCSWSDALFMAPPVFAKYANVTNDTKYFEYIDNEYKKSYDLLYSKEHKLFYRDTRFFDLKEENGRDIFWGRGVGWVVAGLTYLIENIPANYQTQVDYIALYKELMAEIMKHQNKDGYWHTSFLDKEAYPMPENSATGFFTYSLFWGINNGLIEGKEYEESAIKGWGSMVKTTDKNGKVGYIQVVAAAPGFVDSNDTTSYGLGAFLLSGSEYVKYLVKKL